MTDHTRTFHTRFHTGPLRGRTIAVDADNDWQAAKRVSDAVGLDTFNCADWPREVPPPGLFDAEPVQTITINEALEALQHGER